MWSLRRICNVFLVNHSVKTVPDSKRRQRRKQGNFPQPQIYFGGCCQGGGKVSWDLQNVSVRVLRCVCACLQWLKFGDCKDADRAWPDDTKGWVDLGRETGGNRWQESIARNSRMLEEHSMPWFTTSYSAKRHGACLSSVFVVMLLLLFPAIINRELCDQFFKLKKNVGK